MAKHLSRSKSDRVLGGVCAGLGGHLGLNSTLVRVFFILLALADGIGIFLYLLLWVVLPPSPDSEQDLGSRIGEVASEVGGRARQVADEVRRAVSQPRPAIYRWIGVTMVLLGSFFLLRNLELVWIRWLELDLLWPGLLVIAGLIVIFRRGVEHAS